MKHSRQLQTGKGIRLASIAVALTVALGGPAGAAAQALNQPINQLPSFADLAARMMPTVVSIQVEQTIELSQGRPMPGPGPGQRQPPGGPDPFDFFRFFGQEMPREFHNRGIGSGVFIDAQGLILTNAHVVENATEIQVSYMQPNGAEKTVKAKVLGTAPSYDVALIKTENDARVPVAPLGDSDAIRIGDWVMAIGNPFGLTHSVSVGIISAKERRDLAPSGREGIYDFLQTDASINPGNSGGPLMNIRGEVVGINAAINAQGAGIGFAIPINMIKVMLPQLKKGGRFVRSWIGVKIQPLTPELAQSYGLSDTTGVLVAEIVPDSPGARAGLREGDIILKFDGKQLTKASDLPLLASMAGVGKKVPLEVYRGGKTRRFDITLEAFPEDQPVAAPEEEGESNGGLGLGVALSDITPEMRERLDIQARQGALVRDITMGGPAARAGIRPGDVIVRVDGADVTSARDAVSRLKKVKSGEVVRLQVERQGSRIFVALKKP